MSKSNSITQRFSLFFLDRLNAGHVTAEAGRDGTGRANMKRSGALGVPEWVNEGGFRILKVEIDSLDSFDCWYATVFGGFYAISNNIFQ